MPASLPTVLEEIVAERRTHLDGIRERLPITSASELTPSTRSLFNALQGSHRFIMECKSQSPSLGMIRESYDPGAIARVYSRYASAISVLCEPERFGGDYDHLATVAASTHLPVLCKDFIVDDVQVLAARFFGADAILLMLSVLSDHEYARLSALAGELSLDVLTEVIDEEEMARADRLGARIIGINHRNLHDLSIDLSRSACLAPLAPAGSVIVAESGIRDHATVVELSGHANGFLVGSQLTGHSDIDTAVRELVYGENKVCGLTRGSEAQAARATGAVFGGLIFEERSPRHVSAECAREIIAAEPGLRYVAVTRSDGKADGFHDLALPGITAIQLHAPHGTIDEERDLLERARETGLEVWRAISMTHPNGPKLALALAEHVDRFVLDAGAGGTGETFNWDLIPAGIPQNTLLAGGIGLENLPDALTTGLGVDLNSGLEVNGRKNAGLMRRAFDQIRYFTHSHTPEGETHR